MQLVNAFLKPVIGGGKSADLLGESRAQLEKHHAKLKHVWGLAPTVEETLSEEGDTTFDEFAARLTAHVS